MCNRRLEGNRAIANAALSSGVVRLFAVLGLAFGASCGSDGTSPSTNGQPATPASIVISGDATTALAVGSTVQLTAAASDASGAVVANAIIDWRSSATSIATVTSAGLVTGIAPGTVTITAANGSAAATRTVTVITTIGDWSQVTEWTTYQGNAAHTSYVPVIADPALFAERWSGTIGTGAATGAIEANGRVFAVVEGSNGPGTVTTFGAASGTVIWTKSLGPNASTTAPAYVNGTVVIQTEGDVIDGSFLRGYDAVTGAERFKISYAGQRARHLTPTVADGIIYFDCSAGRSTLCAQTAADGGQLWSSRVAESVGFDAWTPSVVGGVAYTYAGSAPPMLTAVNAVTGATLYQIADPFFFSSAAFGTAPVVEGGRAFVTNTRRLIAFDLTGRRIAWQMTGTFTGSVAAANGVLYVSTGNTVEARNPVDGTLLWSWTAPPGHMARSLIVTKNLLFAGTSLTSTIQHTYAVDLATHLTVWTIPIGLQLSIGPSGTLYIAQGSGVLTAVKLK